ncbi:putative inactive ribonuclease-like protein 12 [Paroedura picta]|uniref:putative inactive ribonuclease-like protein 12 n=1 Tax=Paroedura picta TaxID=143630 RepID=UPI00405608B2
MVPGGARLGAAASFLLLAAWLALSSAESYEKFLREHVDFPPSTVPDRRFYCDVLMQRRRLATPHHCKHLNTFVHAHPTHLIPICGPAGQATTGDLRESNETFPLTLCKLRHGSWAPDCRYQATSGVERIIIACENGFPVHLETEEP